MTLMVLIDGVDLLTVTRMAVQVEDVAPVTPTQVRPHGVDTPLLTATVLLPTLVLI